jgi:hypothetical protein
MKNLQLQVWLALSTFFALASLGSVPTVRQNPSFDAMTSIASGVHLWYQIKADPETPSNLILCGTKWDASTNGPYGFVYASSDSGSSWRVVLEDRNSAWVTEHSCAFGSQHRAYFISEASKVIDGEPHHDLGVTRLFVSADAGEHWTEAKKTGWADYSTSAVSSATARLYTFFNAPSTSDPGRNRGNSVGLLVFSPDGTAVQGPFFFSPQPDYQGVYPRDATPLRNGEVAALYYAARKTAAGMEVELGLVRAGQSAEPALEGTAIASGSFDQDCLSFDHNALAYDRERNRLFVVYVEGCKNNRMMLTSSDDEGKTWAKSVAVAEREAGTAIKYPSLVARSDGKLAVLWSEWRGAAVQWFFGEIQDKKFVGSPINLSPNAETLEVRNDSLRTTIERRRGVEIEGASALSGPAIVVGVRGLVDVLWRESGLLAVGDRILAIWPSIGPEGMRLNSRVLDARPSVSNEKNSADLAETPSQDVTARSVITYAGKQSFDHTTGTLTVWLAVANRGNEAMRLPIKLEAADIESPAGRVSVLNGTNNLEGSGAIWDISSSVTGDRLPPGTKTNPFCLLFRVPGLSRSASPLDEGLLTLKMRVIASTGESR